MACELCEQVGGELVYQNERCRVVLVNDPDYIGFCRVIWKNHIREMTDLTDSDRTHFMAIVFVVEDVLRKLLRPEKINLASLGNMTPHLHWHVIPRFTDDKHFPNPIWGAGLREPSEEKTNPNLAKEIQASLRAHLD